MPPPSPTPSGPSGPAGPRLRPGVHVVRRDAEHLQVGLDRRRAVVLPDVAPVRELLDRLDGFAVGTSPGLDALDRADRVGAVALQRLAHADLLVDATALAGDRARHGSARATAAYLRWGTDAGERLERRRHSRVDLLAPVRAGAVEDLREDLDLLGLAVAADARPADELADDISRELAVTGGTGDGVRVVLALSDGPLPRSHLDPLVRTGVPHLVVSGEGSGLRVGPFVVPGATACLRCLDAHEGTEDPRWGLVREQVATFDRPVGPDPLDQRLALAWAAADLLRYVDGDVPSTWSATIALGPAAPRTTSWRRHPHCGCSWDVLSPTG